MENTGERQTSPTLDGIKADHRQRYAWAEKHIPKGASILDGACGCGYGSFILASSDKEFKVTGVDVSEEAIEFAKSHYQAVQDNPQYMCSDILNFDVTGVTQYDWIICFETLEHLVEDDALIANYAKLTDNLLISSPNELFNPWDKETYPFHIRHYTIQDLSALLTKHGFTVASVYTQYDKIPGDVYEADDGRTLIVEAIK
jgi:2-polyprenyl-3-methyl-5-hydroxy-6-metoxy-1,4-benzoquinol methylase